MPGRRRYKPSSVPPVRRASGFGGEGHLSGPAFADGLSRWTSGSGLPAAIRSSLTSPLLGLAPGGVYRAGGITAAAVRSYRTISPLPPSRRTGPKAGHEFPPARTGGPGGFSRRRRCIFCGTFPIRRRLPEAGAGRWALPTTVAQWCSDFPPPAASDGERPSTLPATRHYTRGIRLHATAVSST